MNPSGQQGKIELRLHLKWYVYAHVFLALYSEIPGMWRYHSADHFDHYLAQCLGIHDGILLVVIAMRMVLPVTASRCDIAFIWIGWLLPYVAGIVRALAFPAHM
jgi:hypothetical protein